MTEIRLLIYGKRRRETQAMAGGRLYGKRECMQDRKYLALTLQVVSSFGK